jgi:predicted metal-dependent TIM-barrel fold hydrolase
MSAGHRGHWTDCEIPEPANVLGIGEIGLNKNSRNELKVLELHVDLAARHDQLILVHTPTLRISTKEHA